MKRDLTVLEPCRTASHVYLALLIIRSAKGNKRKFGVRRSTISKVSGIDRLQTISEALEYLSRNGWIGKQVQQRGDMRRIIIDMGKLCPYSMRCDVGSNTVAATKQSLGHNPSDRQRPLSSSEIETADATISRASFPEGENSTQKSKNYFRGDLVLTKAGLKGIVTRLPDNGRVVVDVITKADNGIILESTQSAYLESELTKAPELACDPLIMALKKEHEAESSE